MAGWFAAGTLVGGLLMLTALAVLSLNLYWTCMPSSGHEPVLAPLIPGMNVPFSQTPYLFAALLVSAIVHEFGHALAAAAWRKRYQSVGMFLMFIYPGAFVNFVEGFDELSPKKQLQIYCAGAWHNTVGALIAIAILTALPVLLSPLYLTGEGVVVHSVMEGSPLEKHLSAGEVIVGLDHCFVRAASDWEQCLLQMLQEPDVVPGYCSTDLALDLATANGRECCTDMEDYAGPMQCFSAERLEQSYCMPARQVANQPFCLGDEDCSYGMDARTCLKPLNRDEERTIKVTLNDGRFVLFSGHPSLLYFYVLVGGYVPQLPGVGLHMPHYLERTFGYLLSVSAALALLNMAPVYMFDGEHACLAFLKLLFPSWRKTFRDNVATWLLRASTGLLAVNIVASLVFLAMKG